MQISISMSEWKTDMSVDPCVDCGASYGCPAFPRYAISDFVQQQVNPDKKLICPACLAWRCNQFGLTNVAFRYLSGPFAQRD